MLPRETCNISPRAAPAGSPGHSGEVQSLGTSCLSDCGRATRDATIHHHRPGCHFLSTSHTTRAHARRGDRRCRAAAISFLGYLLELWGRLARGGRQRRSRCLGAWDRSLRELRLPGSAAALLSTRSERVRCGSLSGCGACWCGCGWWSGFGCLHQLSGRWCGVGGRSGPRLFLLLGRRLLVSASVTELGRWQPPGSFGYCSRSSAAACQSAFDRDPRSAFKRDPLGLRFG